MAVVLAVTAVVLLAVSAALGAEADSVWLRLLYILAQWIGPLLLLAAAAHVLWHRLQPWITARLVELVGPALISAMPPRTVINAVLARVFGDKIGHQEVATALIGGSGRDPLARDTAVSKETAVHIGFERIDESACLTEFTWSHEFSGVRNNHRLVLFATFDRDIYSTVISERTYPLFEAWRVYDEEQLEQFGASMKEKLDVGITYRDKNGGLHRVAPAKVQGEEVALRDFDQFVRLPDWVDRKNLVIYQVDLYDLADADHVVESIERLTLRTSTVGLFDQGFVFWSAPHPCFVSTVVFDVRRLARGNEKLVYQVVASTLRLTDVPLDGTWTHVPDEIEVVVDSWMLPGHAVTLLWRPVNGAEPQHASHGW